ncbi:hypothetical protein BGY98DRAFT_1001712, partial [Russula aff. rugulosa BPL654]
MLSIGSKGTDLEYKMKEQATVVCVEFDPLLLGYEEVKPRPLALDTVRPNPSFVSFRFASLPTSKTLPLTP